MSVHIFLQLVLLLATVTSYSSFSLPSTHSIYSAVHHFETLHKAYIYHRVLRDGMYHTKDDLKQVEFTTLGRHFRLMLSPNTRSFHPFLQTKSSDHQHVINYHQFLQGHVFGLEFSHVTAHMTDEGIVTAIITIDDEEYYIEPSHRHIKESHDFHMITYRRSDLKFNMTGNPDEHFCGVSSGHHSDLYDITNPTHFIKQKGNNHTPGYNMKHRLKRQSVPEADKVCPINLVATTSFHERFGGSPPEPENTINYLLVVILQIDAIFRGTNWVIPGVSGSASPGVRGLQIDNVDVLESTDSSPDYNEDINWDSENLLREFAETDWEDYCISHLFTARSFSDSSRLGLAYCACDADFTGICVKSTTMGNRPFSGNVGVSTYSARNRLLLLAESIVVTAHEIGHNWGSPHDPPTSECSPSQDNGGKFLMYPIAQDGSSENNNNFSNCSIRSITKFLNKREDDCFTTPRVTQCGNFRIDVDEECDPGPAAVVNDGDLCCTDKCTLRSNFTCSDTNHDCCDQCFPSSLDTICFPVKAGNSECFGNRTCDGNSVTCPIEQVYVENGTECGIMGLCLVSDNPIQTHCENFCELNNLITCHCNDEDQCFICCKESTNSSCKPFNDETELPLPDGSFCEGGTCQNGVCILSDPDFASFFSDLFTDFSTSAFAQFLYENIVGSVIILSLIFWIPVSVLAHIFEIWWEKKREEHQNQKKSNTEK